MKPDVASPKIRGLQRKYATGEPEQPCAFAVQGGGYSMLAFLS